MSDFLLKGEFNKYFPQMAAVAMDTDHLSITTWIPKYLNMNTTIWEQITG